MADSRKHLAAVVLLLLVGGMARAAERTDEPQAPTLAPLPPVHTRQGVFSIPFRIDGLASGGAQPAEVRLFVSEDQGAKWRAEGRVKPEQQSFGFRAPHDGEYWFSIRTVDDQGRAHPDGPYEAQLRVIVDTLTPRLDLSAARGDGGEIIARWQVLDTGLKPDTFKLEYQTAPGEAWQPLAIDAQSQRLSKYTLVGQATWWPPARGTAVLLRATVGDEAGNSAVNQVQIAARGQEAQTPAAGPLANPLLNRGGERRTADSPRAWPADASTDQPLERALPGSQRHGESLAGNPADRRGGEPAWRPVSRPATDGRRDEAASRVLAQPVGQSFAGAQPAPATGGADWSLLPLGERPRMVNLRTFELDYEVDSIGSSGIAKVELWGTRDGGRHWASFGFDNDNRTPLVVSVDGEGLYGFRVVIQSGNGLSGQPPRDGDLPEVWIGVDLTRPVARLTAVEPALEGGELTLRWEASDALLEARPVTLLFSDQPRGPWTPIASGLENTGSFGWRLDSRVPERIYLRLEARDEAGNVGMYETNDPVTIDRQRPQGHIRGVRPLGQTSRGGRPTTSVVR